jgi:hypothetical protein
MDDCMQAGTNKCGGYKNDNKKLVIANSKSDWHHTSICHRQVTSGPNAINWFTSSKVCSPELPCREFPDHLLHTETIQICQFPPQLPLINIFVCINTQDKTFAILLPLLHVSKKIVTEACACIGVIFQFVNQMMAMLLVHCAQILLLICAGGVSANNPGDNPIISNELHVSPVP